MGRVTADRLDPGNPGHHRGQVTAIAQIRPVRRHPAAQRAGPADIQHPATGIPEPVDAGRARQPRRCGRPVAPHQAAPPAICAHATWLVSPAPRPPRRGNSRGQVPQLDTSGTLTNASARLAQGNRRRDRPGGRRAPRFGEMTR